MCDTLVAAGKATADAAVIMAKNSDRDPNEAQPLVHIPRASHQPGAVLRCTYIRIPQVAETYEVLLSQPFWLWGCEMGANECGVAIGNEAVWTREPYDTGPGLIGMDFIRLALERSATAASALETITGLLGEWREILSRCVDEAEKFTREKPAAGLSVAFLAGIFLASLLRRR